MKNLCTSLNKYKLTGFWQNRTLQVCSTHSFSDMQQYQQTGTLDPSSKPVKAEVEKALQWI